MSFVLVVSLVVLIASVALYGDLTRGWNRLRQLRDVSPILPPMAPPV
jgi:hypothetical protein